MMQKGFTLIELLIVVAIIAILAAIAVPNFLEAQVRARVSRVKNDLRSMATALESYRVDNNNYPPRGLYSRNPSGGVTKHSGFVLTLDPIWVTTPIAYLSSEASLLDTFQSHLYNPSLPKTPPSSNWARGRFYYTATKQTPEVGNVVERILQLRFGGWRIAGAGPDKQVFNDTFNDTNNNSLPILIPYDPTNGTVSVGDMLRSQKEPEVSLRSTLLQP